MYNQYLALELCIYKRDHAQCPSNGNVAKLVHIPSALLFYLLNDALARASLKLFSLGLCLQCSSITSITIAFLLSFPIGKIFYNFAIETSSSIISCHPRNCSLSKKKKKKGKSLYNCIMVPPICK